MVLGAGRDVVILLGYVGEGITTESVVDDGVEDASVEEDNDDCVLGDEVLVIESF